MVCGYTLRSEFTDEGMGREFARASAYFGLICAVFPLGLGSESLPANRRRIVPVCRLVGFLQPCTPTHRTASALVGDATLHILFRAPRSPASTGFYSQTFDIILRANMPGTLFGCVQRGHPHYNGGFRTKTQ